MISAGAGWADFGFNNTPGINEQAGEEISDHLYVYWKNGAERMEKMGVQGGTIPIRIGPEAAVGGPLGGWVVGGAPPPPPPRQSIYSRNRRKPPKFAQPPVRSSPVPVFFRTPPKISL